MSKFFQIEVRCLIAIVLLSACPGCHTRYYAVSDAPDKGEHIRTRYKYWIIGSSEERLPYSVIMPDVFSLDGIPVEVSGPWRSDYNYSSCHGSIANLDTGSNMSRESQEVLQAIVGATGIWLIPVGIMALYSLDIDSEEETLNYNIEILGSTCTSHLRVYKRKDEMTGLCLCLPVPYFCYYGDPAPKAFDKGRKFTNHVFSQSGFEKAPTTADRAFIYGLAARLKDLEDSGAINETVARNAPNIRKDISENRRKVLAEMQRREKEEEQEQERLRLQEEARRKQAQELLADQRRKKLLAVRQRQQTKTGQSPKIVQIVQPVVQQEPQKPKFSILTFEPANTSDNFSYSFEVTLNGEADPDEFINMWESVVIGLKRIYLSQNPAIDEKSLVIEAEPSLRNGKFVGIAKILTIRIENLTYDSATRRGRIVTSFGPGQEQFARTWIKDSIMEPLVKDKNILLTTGVEPPPGKYYSLGEKIDGNVLEIEFKTE